MSTILNGIIFAGAIHALCKSNHVKECLSNFSKKMVSMTNTTLQRFIFDLIRCVCSCQNHAINIFVEVLGFSHESSKDIEYFGWVFKSRQNVFCSITFYMFFQTCPNADELFC